MDKEKKSLEVEKQKEQENLFKLSLFEQQLRQKEEIINEKLRTGKKLTTEDLLVIQSLDR